MKYLYGWGASVVLIGALFKLQHWPGAGIMLTIGMSTEAIIFFFSAFEPLVDEVDWTIVYPELAGITDAGGASRHSGGGMDPALLERVITNALAKSSLAPASAVQSPIATSPAPVASTNYGGTGGGMVFTEKFNEMLEKAQIGPDLFVNIGHGLDRLSEASNGIARISDAVAATEKFSHNLQRAGGAVGKFAESYENSGNLLSRTAEVLSKTFETTASGIDSSSKEFTQRVQEIVSQMGTQMSGASSSVSAGVEESAKQLLHFNKSLETMNAAHELQVKNMQARVKDSERLGVGVDEMLKQLIQSVEDSKKYSQSVAKLTANVSQLSNVYGNMLSAMGSVVNTKA